MNTFQNPVVVFSPALFPKKEFLSPSVIAVPASYPNRVFLVALVPLKLSPAFVPPMVFSCASESTPVSYTHLTLPTIYSV